MNHNYRRMIKRLSEKAESAVVKKRGGARRKEKDPRPWFVYLVRCSDGSLYTGITNDIERRLKCHNAGKGSRYTCLRRPVILVYQEECGTRAQALIREFKIKTLPKAKKESFVLTTG